MNTIKVEIDTENQLISVWNNGAGIPVEIHQKEKIYVPELIFGNLLTSSNYDDDEKKVVGGRNGFGAKLANIFSNEFTVETADAQRGKKYKQVFRKNMSEKDKPSIKSNGKKEAYTKISFSPDLTRFGMTHLDDDIVSLMKKRVYDIAGISSNLKVYLNGKKIPVKSFKDYVALYNDKGGPSTVMYERISDRWEVAITASEGQLTQLSFVNSIWTIKGGTHVTHVADQIVSKVAEHIAKKNKGTKVKPFQIKSQLSLYINCLIENPSFDSQTKETLTTKPSKFGSKWSLSADLTKKVMNSEIIENVLAFAKFKESKELAKTDGGKRVRLTGITKFYDANRAGTREGSKCTLVLTEGDSAMATAFSGLSVVGRDYYGVYPLRGKMLNVREAKHKQIMDNKEINNLKKILGLQHNKKYCKETMKSLRYGHVLIMADQDHDGSHIKGLIINFFDHFWPGLLQIDGFLQELITPIVQCTKGQKKKVFFTIPEYETFCESSESAGWEGKYFKGLGTSTSADAKSYFSDLPTHLHEFKHTGVNDTDMIELAFSKQRVNDRKDWIASYAPGTYFHHGVDELNYANFVNKELILFSVYDNERSIPCVVDGFKPSQRKVMFGCFKRKLTKKELKVVQLAGYISEQTAYRHGDVSLQSTIVGLGQNFVGSNNLNFLVPAGQFGTRLTGGKDAASARYICTKLAPIARAMFPEADDAVLSYLVDEDKVIEPKWYCPIIPTVLVNGSEGIGTGWSSSVPCYNPRELIANIRRLLAGNRMEPMMPWYRGFNGSIVPVQNSKSYDIYGTLRKSSEENVFKVEELPIKAWTSAYKDFLESVLIGSSEGDSPFLKDFHDNSTENTVNFTLMTTPAVSRTLSSSEGYKKLKLTSSVTTSNMVLFNKDGRLRKYENPEEILQEFFETRYALYEDRRLHLLKELEQKLLCLDNKQRFILLVIDDKLKVAKRRKDQLLADLVRLKFDPIHTGKAKKGSPADTPASDSEENDNSPQSGDKRYDYLLSMPLWSLTAERVANLADQRNKTKAEKDAMEEVTVEDIWEADLCRLEEAIVREEKETAVMAKDLERVAKVAHARQQKGRGRKGAKKYDETIIGDLEVVPLPNARSAALKKVRARKTTAEEKKSIVRGSNTAARKKNAKDSPDDDMVDIISLRDSSSEESDDEEDIVHLMDDVALDDDEVRKPSLPKTRRPQKRSAKRAADIPDDLSEDDMFETQPKAKRTVRTTRTKTSKRDVIDISTSEDDDKSTMKENRSTANNVGLDFSVDSDEDESLSLSQRLAKRLTVSDDAPKKSGKAKTPSNNPVPKQRPSRAGFTKRSREPAPKKSVGEGSVFSPSPSPQQKKTRVRSPQARKNSKRPTTSARGSEDLTEGGDVGTVEVETRPRRQRATKKKVVFSESESSGEEDDDFLCSDDDFEGCADDDSDFE
ncbi:unnamed protein product [Chondrus crispus]|uniref:DNA topoisomerase 2 n=1 Tax=Chondrus crispus TaxID=2769 RepID=R7QHX8_CHOCR|nr:unnamed protein product [Chondrus crispus]CDF38122.1 unnamed protein product [Chondrus crispus]|eukprot:XP_005717991.1 unnamed protein product [Chondrus crispus]